jgi:hypothetical protein
MNPGPELPPTLPFVALVGFFPILVKHKPAFLCDEKR